MISKVTKEINERLERQKNVIVFGLNESSSNLKDEVTKHDSDLVQDMCRSLADEDLRYTTKRLGKKPTKKSKDEQEGEASHDPRPMLISFVDTESKSKLMRNLYKLGQEDISDMFHNISVKHDMTPDEREKEKVLRSKTKEMNEVCEEKNVKYVVRGPPWEREITKMLRKGNRLVPYPDPSSDKTKSRGVAPAETQEAPQSSQN
jgi:TolB-like protein